MEEDNVATNRISIQTWSENDEVFAEVRDTGKGIPQENRELIFEPFFTTNVAGKGSGLGLAICRSIVNTLGGRIEVSSELGIGTRFTVSLPSTNVEVSPRVQSAPEAPMMVAPRGRVLIVDDEALIREGLRELLGDQHVVTIAASGCEARAIVERGGAFDVILCDLMMPNVSGMDFHAWLNRRDPVLASRVVFMSGGISTPKASSYLASVDNLKLDKPFDSSMVEILVAKLVVAAKTAAAQNRGRGV
jgi:CheY-like chemotaxis protein